jgi:Fur family ferric uptake transcriptional regulator
MRGRRNSSTASSTESLRERLRAAGLRSTGARVAVLRVLEGAAAPMSHAEVHERVTGEGFDRATIYRNLIDLTDAGLVSRSDVGDHVWRFELRGERAAHAAAHAHFVCTDCGDVSCLPDEAVRLVSAPNGVPRAIGERQIEVQVKGVCDRCA